MKFLFSEPPSNTVRLLWEEGGVSCLREKKGARELRVSLEKKAGLSRRNYILESRKAVVAAKNHRVRSFVCDPTTLVRRLTPQLSEVEAGELLATAFLMANFEFVAFKTKPKEGWNMVEKVYLPNASALLRRGIARGALVGEEVNRSRALSNTPGGDMTPEYLANAARKAVRGLPVRVRVLGVKEMRRLGMGGVLGVGKGSAAKPRFIILEYRNASKKKSPVVFVGKGVTFDTGGLNLKPETGMYEMHLDMSGGAAVIHAVALAARLKVRINLVGLIPAAENMPSGTSYRPGDILRSLSGKTIEVLNTDAEGRIILADAITYAKRYRPAVVVEVSTLTGASLVALGQHASAILSKDDALIQKAQEAGERSGDYVWPLPLWEEYEDMTKGTFGDVPNISTAGNSRYGGVIAGAMFLQKFAQDLSCPFLHIDMAPRMTAAPGEHLSKGSAGAPVRLLLSLAESYARS